MYQRKGYLRDAAGEGDTDVRAFMTRTPCPHVKDRKALVILEIMLLTHMTVAGLGRGGKSFGDGAQYAHPRVAMRVQAHFSFMYDVGGSYYTFDELSFIITQFT